MAKVAIKKREYRFFRWNLSYYGRFLKVGLWKRIHQNLFSCHCRHTL